MKVSKHRTEFSTMSGIFHRTCYTSRSSGYKYRTLSTNTGERKRRDSKDSTFEKKFKELKREITTRIDYEVENAQGAREHMNIKFQTIDDKINTMLELQETVNSLKDDLHIAESTLTKLLVRVEKLNAITGSAEPNSSPKDINYSNLESPLVRDKRTLDSSFSPNTNTVLAEK